MPPNLNTKYNERVQRAIETFKKRKDISENNKKLIIKFSKFLDIPI